MPVIDSPLSDAPATESAPPASTPRTGRPSISSESRWRTPPPPPPPGAGIQFIWCLCGLLVLLGLLWLPFGLRTPARVEGYGIAVALDLGMPAVDWERARPLAFVRFAVARWIDPDYFLGVNLIHIAALLAKGLAVFLLVRWLAPRRADSAWLAACLALLFPTDLGNTDNRMTHIQVACALYLWAVVLLVAYWRDRGAWRLAGAVALAAASLLTYDGALALVAGTPIVLVLYRRSTLRRLVAVAGCWYLALGVRLAHLTWLKSIGVPTDTDGALAYLLSEPGLRELVSRTARAGWRHAAGGWRDAWLFLLADPRFLVHAAASAAVAALVMWALWRQRRSLQPAAPTGLPPSLALLLLGSFLFVAGYLPYIGIAEMFDGNRTYLFAMPGAAMAAGGLLLLLKERWRLTGLLGAVACGGLVLLGSNFALRTQQTIVQESLMQQRYLADMMLQAPHVAGKTLLVLYDESPGGDSLRTHLVAGEFQNAVWYFYEGQDVRAFVCGPALKLSFAPDTCAFTDAGIVIGNQGLPPFTVPYDQTLLFRYRPDTGAVLQAQVPADIAPPEWTRAYAPGCLIDQQAAPPKRLLTALTLGPHAAPAPRVTC